MLSGRRSGPSYLSERRSEEKELRRAQILDAAEAIANEKGWDALTIIQVARRARLSRALVYLFFKDKTHLLFAICDRALTTLMPCLAEAAARETRGIEQLDAIARAYVAFSHESPTSWRALAQCELLAVDPHNVGRHIMQSRHECCRDLVVRAVTLGITDGSIRADAEDSALVSAMLWDFVRCLPKLTAIEHRLGTAAQISGPYRVEHALQLVKRCLEQPVKPNPCERHGMQPNEASAVRSRTR